MALSKINNDSFADSAVHGRRNLIINGSMQVAQRGATATTSAGFQNVDRFQSNSSQATITRSQQTLSSGDPYDDGFRKFYRLQVTSASSNTNSYAEIHQPMEGQNIVHSGWDYTSTSSKITLSFWARSSLAGTYYIMYRIVGSSERRRNGAFTLAADTWTKVTFTTAGNSGLTINNDNTREFDVFIVPHYGTSFTGGEEVSTTDWYDRNSQGDAYLPNFAQNWANTANATFDVTGVQLEVGDKATPFEHRSFAEELALCQRYHYRRDITIYDVAAMGGVQSTNRGAYLLHIPVAMRAKPSCSQGSNIYCWYSAVGQVTAQSNLTVVYMDNLATDFNQVYIMADASSTLNSVGHPLALTSYHSSGTADTHVSLDAEL